MSSIIGGAATFPPRMRLICHVVFQHLHQPGFANAPFPSQKHDLPLSSLSLLPTLQQQSDFLLSTDKWGQTSRGSNVKAALDTTFL